MKAIIKDVLSGLLIFVLIMVVGIRSDVAVRGAWQ